VGAREEISEHRPWRTAGLPPADSHPRVFVFAPVRLYREGVAGVLERAGMAVTGLAADWPEALDELFAHPPDVAVLDVAGPRGLAIVRELRHHLPATRIVVLAIVGAERDVIEWAEAGISGYVTKDGSLEDLVRAVESAARHEAHCEPCISGALLERLHVLANSRPATPSVASLTAREREICALLEAGLPNKEIAAQLHIELPTVKNHVHSILGKLGVARRADAATELRRTGHHL
jgi:two-component system nitrate/nitrite response regulator NarL